MIKQTFHINSLQTVLLLAVIDIKARCTMWYEKIQSDHSITHKCKLTNINELCNLQSALMQRYPHAINNLEQYPNRHYTLNISFSERKQLEVYWCKLILSSDLVPQTKRLSLIRNSDGNSSSYRRCCKTIGSPSKLA